MIKINYAPKNTRKINEAGQQLLKLFEECKLHPYLDKVGIPTIGWGNTFYEDGTTVKMYDPPITQEKADDVFLKIVAGFERIVYENVKALINQNQFNALVSFCYNVGMNDFCKSTLLKMVNKSPNDFHIHEQFMCWIYGWSPEKKRKVIIKGLINRREMESKIYFIKS